MLLFFLCPLIPAVRKVSSWLRFATVLMMLRTAVAFMGHRLPQPTIRRSSLFAKSTVYTIMHPIEATEIVKKSRFIGKLSPIKSAAEALLIVKQQSEPKASHNCWAFRTSSIPSYERCSDDGEPGGTAGRPILMALESEGVVDALVVVTRYFGGTKLGVGGLSRAYGLAAQNVIAAAVKVPVVPASTLKVTAAVSDLGSLYQAVNSLSGLSLSIADNDSSSSKSGEKGSDKGSEKGSGKSKKSAANSIADKISNYGSLSNEKYSVTNETVNDKESSNSGNYNFSHTDDYIVRLSEVYNDDATSVILRIKMPTEFVEFFTKKVIDSCRGNAEVEKEVEEKVDNEAENDSPIALDFFEEQIESDEDY